MAGLVIILTTDDIDDAPPQNPREDSRTATYFVPFVTKIEGFQ